MEYKIYFDRNYNKFGDKLFLSCRRKTRDNIQYYSKGIGKLFDVYIEDTPWFKARLLDLYFRSRKMMREEFVSYDTDDVYELADENIVLVFLKDNCTKCEVK